MTDRLSFTCPCCGAVSYNRNDVAQRFCGRCHDWTGDPLLAARHFARDCPHRTEGRTATVIPDAAVRAAIAEHARLLSDRPDPMVLSDETLFRRVLEAALPHLHPEPRERAVYAGGAVVAGWLGVTRDAFGNWLRRYDDFPEPAATVMGPQRESWCWLPEQCAEWVAWAKGKDVSCNPPPEGTGS